MKSFNLKGELLIEHPYNDEVEPARTLYPELLRMAEPGWMHRIYASGEVVQPRECDVEAEELEHAREWLAHVRAGRIGGVRRD